jgi:RimJ/RimL family protein N-acetyltransferase
VSVHGAVDRLPFGDLGTSMKPMVRKATADDAPWYVDHVHSLAAEHDLQIPLGPGELFRTPEQQAELFSEARARGDLFLVAEINGRCVGEVNLRRGIRAAFKHSAVLGISVMPAWRKKQIGTILMQHALAWAAGEGALRRIELFVFASNSSAIRLYERFGFVVEGRRRDAIRIGGKFVDDLLMAYIDPSPSPSPTPAPR